MELDKKECQKCGRKDDLFRIDALNPNKPAKFYCGDHMGERDLTWKRPEPEKPEVKKSGKV